MNWKSGGLSTNSCSKVCESLMIPVINTMYRVTPTPPDLQAFHKMIRPKMLIPMHGEYAHLVQHTAMAIAGGMTSVVAPNGTVVDLSDDTPAIVNHARALPNWRAVIIWG